jgi:hypothetical protein
MLITQSGKFQKFKFKTLPGISSNTGRQESKQIEFTVGCIVLARSRTVATLLDDATVEPRSLCPDLSREKWGGGREMRPGPPPSPSSSCTLPTTMDAPEPTHSPPQPRRQPPSKPPRPPSPVRPPNAARTPALATFWSPCPRPPEAIKTPVDPSQRTHTPPQPIPTLLFSSLPRKRPISARERHRVLENSGHHWSCCWSRWRSGAAVVDLHHRRQALLPLRHALAVEHSSLQRR